MALDAAYSNLLTHLRHSSTSQVSVDTLATSLAYHLSRPPVTSSSPTPLAAAVAQSPVWHPLSLETCVVLRDAFTQATVLYYNEITKKEAGIFSRSHKSRLNEWLRAVDSGLAGGPLVLRIACTAGVLTGINHCEKTATSPKLSARDQLELELLQSLSSVLDTSTPAQQWRTDFESTHATSDMQTLSIVIAAEHMANFSATQLRTVNLDKVIKQTVSCLVLSFSDTEGHTFLSTKEADVHANSSRPSSAPLISSLSSNITKTLNKPTFKSIAVLSKLCAACLNALADDSPAEFFKIAQWVLDSLRDLSVTVTSEWLKTPMANQNGNAEIALRVQEMSTEAWNILKSLLFMNIMVIQTILSTGTYSSQSLAFSRHASTQALYSLALGTLGVLDSLSFVVAQFGGISPTAGSGFMELKRVTYSALDILANDQPTSNRFVQESLAKATRIDGPEDVRLSHISFCLACAEQLVPILSESAVRESLLPLCIPRLEDPSNRLLFESAHSVVLAIFASISSQPIGDVAKEKLSTLVREMAPFYLKTLILNSKDDHLTTEQLTLAFTTLIRAVASIHEHAGSRTTHALVVYSLQSIQDALYESEQSEELRRAQRLRLSLVSCLSGVPPSLTPHSLSMIDEVVSRLPIGSQDCTELLEAIYGCVLNDMGDAQKEIAMSWWHERRMRWGGHDTVAAQSPTIREVEQM